MLTSCSKSVCNITKFIAVIPVSQKRNNTCSMPLFTALQGGVLATNAQNIIPIRPCQKRDCKNDGDRGPCYEHSCGPWLREEAMAKLDNCQCFDKSNGSCSPGKRAKLSENICGIGFNKFIVFLHMNE